MARPEKESFDYFSLDVDYFEDPRIQDLFDEYGGFAELIYIRILCIVFSDHGYYAALSEEQLTKKLFRSLKGRHSPSISTVKEMIAHMADSNLINKAMLSAGVVTSHGIQVAFMNMAIRCKRRKKITKFSLLSAAEMVEFNIKERDIITEETRVNSEETPVNSEVMHQSKVKESKLNKSKNDEFKINIDEEFYENYFEPTKWTKVLIDNGIISISDLNIPRYNSLFREVIDNYRVADMARAYGYLVQYLKHPSYEITDMYAYIRHALIHNTDWVSHEDERTAYFEQLSIQLEEYKRQHGIVSDEDLNDDDSPFRIL